MERRRHVRARIAHAVVAWLGALLLLVAGARTSPAMELLGALNGGAIATDEASRTWQGGGAPNAERAEASHGTLTNVRDVRVPKRTHDRPPATTLGFARVPVPALSVCALSRQLVLPSHATRARALSMVFLN